MAKVRKATATATATDVPPELARFRLEDWTHPADAAGVEEAWHGHAGSSVPFEELRAGFLTMRARRRWSEAREAWAVERGMTLRDLPSTVGPVVDGPGADRAR